MAERKVLNKYFSPDFDPSLVKKRGSLKGKVFISRMMLPMTLRCLTCGSYSMIGTKFNMKTLRAPELKYLTIPIWRFHFKCQTCYSWITFRTDPKNTDYVCESGAARNYEADKDFKAAEDSIKAMRAEEEFGDAMKGLENRTGDSKREMEILEAIDEIEEINKRQVVITQDAIVKQLQKADNIQEDDMEEIERVFAKGKKIIEEENIQMSNFKSTGFQVPLPRKREEEKQKKVKMNVRVAKSGEKEIEKKVKKEEQKFQEQKKEQIQEKQQIQEKEQAKQKAVNTLCNYSDDSDNESK